MLKHVWALGNDSGVRSVASTMVRGGSNPSNGALSLPVMKRRRAMEPGGSSCANERQYVQNQRTTWIRMRM